MTLFYPETHFLPYPKLHVKEIGFADFNPVWAGKVEAELIRCASAPGWNPKLIKLEGNLTFIDGCWTNFKTDRIVNGKIKEVNVRQPHSIRVIEYQDHWYLDKLPPNAPRAVKALYKKEVMLSHLRATDYWKIHEDFKLAEQKWAVFLGLISPDLTRWICK